MSSAPTQNQTYIFTPYSPPEEIHKSLVNGFYIKKKKTNPTPKNSKLWCGFFACCQVHLYCKGTPQSRFSQNKPPVNPIRWEQGCSGNPAVQTRGSTLIFYLSATQDPLCPLSGPSPVLLALAWLWCGWALRPHPRANAGAWLTVLRRECSPRLLLQAKQVIL